jgi:membrane-bound metal-dependent hydrolase YbcI (DUF457 family)
MPMDNLSHTIVGAALAKTGLEAKTAWAAPALLLSANLPDIDIFGSLIGQNYLDFHRGITHSLPGVVLLSLALTALLWAGSRLATRDPAKRVSFLPMWFVCLIGNLSNPLLDLLNEYGSRPLLPFSDRRFYGDLLSIVDIWLWLIFGAALILAPRSAKRRFWLALCSLFLGLVVLLAGGVWLALAWILCLGTALAIGTYAKHRGYNAARVAVVAFLIYLGGLALIRGRILAIAREAVPRAIGESAEKIDVLPGRPGTWGRWTVIAQTASKYYISEAGLNGWSYGTPSFESYDKNLEGPEYREALAQSQMAAMARFARFPSVTVERTETICKVLLRDLRYARADSDGWATARAVIPCPRQGDTH